MEVLYFAWVRDRTGIGREHVDPPNSVTTIDDLAGWLARRSAGHAEAFRDPALIRAAVNQEHVPFTHPVTPGDEVAFFPPMTGG